ncbi:MAG: hypothetical protein HKN77_03450 [Woeseiaceae bacterium]|nr:hypothetical protein [Woeseiaceae bacterium]
MTSLTAIFGSTQEDTGDSEKLLELYWNRAELKKEFANLREETFKLKEQISTQQGHTARAQQKYDHIENLLLDPEWVHSVVVFYQLRALNERCKSKLAAFAEQLKQQREKRHHGRLLEEWNAQRHREAGAIEAKIGEQRTHKQLLEDQLQSERHRYSMMGGFMRFFRKRSMKKLLDTISDDIASSIQQEAILQSELTSVRHQEPPDTQGLDTIAKRSINFMILSYAQQLYLHFEDDDLAALAKEAGEKSVGAIRYGTKTDSDFLLEKIKDKSESLAKATACADLLKQRSLLLAENAKFHSADDVVPATDSVNEMFAINSSGAIKKKNVNLVAGNYWDLAKIFSR